MGRMERKLENRKRKKKLQIFLFFIIIIMVVGIVLVDFATREMMALDDTRVLGYESSNDSLLIYALGQKVYIQHEKIEEYQGIIKNVCLVIKEEANKFFLKIIKKLDLDVIS